jgi:hypothetical protein
MSEWRKHVKKTYDDMKKKNSNVLLKHAMKAASKTWKKKTQKKGGDIGGTVEEAEPPLSGEGSEPSSIMGGEEDVMEGGALPKPIGGRKSKKGGKTKKNRK